MSGNPDAAPNATGPATDDLIAMMARQAGTRPRRLPFAVALASAVALAALAALLVVWSVAGARADLGQTMTTGIYWFKLAAMLTLAGGGLHLVRAAARPGAGAAAALALAPGSALLLAGSLLDPSGFPLFGGRAAAAPICVSMIVLAALPGLAVVMRAVRAGVPTRLGVAGAAAGVLAGALGALAYTIACVNDGAAFVSIWYGLAIALVAGLGAILGPRFLAW